MFGILNLTEDSFFDESRRLDPAGAVTAAIEMLRVGSGVSLDIENYCTLRLFFDLSTLAGLNRRNLPEAGILLL
ncbi:dihydropteroate synthase, partial [Salmonella enterica]|nr:dihydropteroate synthase [Salmonella enterica]MDL3158086.1 dihydropteroate synthase [Salmonella enterica]